WCQNTTSSPAGLSQPPAGRSRPSGRPSSRGRWVDAGPAGPKAALRRPADPPSPTERGVGWRMAPPATVPDWLAAGRPGLGERRGRPPWPAAAARVVARLAGWVERYTAELGVANPGCGCAPRLWACWSHHWRTAVEKARQPVDGAEVAAQIEASRGYRRNGHLGGNVILDVVL